MRRWLVVPLAAFAATAAAGIPLVLAILALGGDDSFARFEQSAVVAASMSPEAWSTSAQRYLARVASIGENVRIK